MELLTLDQNRQPKELIEFHDSLVWSERFNTIGDFQLVTGAVERGLTALPEGTIVTLRESNVPMIVERHLIERKKNQGAKLIIRGREFTSILDRRVSLQSVSAAVAPWNVVVKTPSDAAYFAMVKVCVEGIADPKDIFPSSLVQFPTPADYLASTGPNREYNIPRGNLLKTVLDFLQIEADADPTTSPATPETVPHGIRAVRPHSGAAAIAIQIYTGQDKTSTVRFEATRDVMDDGTYLFSKEASATDGYVIGPQGAWKLTKSGGATGLNRRVVLTESQLTNQEALRNQGAKDLSEAKTTAIFDGSINEAVSPYVYGGAYGLGDIVELVGDYGLSTRARVTEYIRSEDATGYKAYPTFSSID